MDDETLNHYVTSQQKRRKLMIRRKQPPPPPPQQMVPRTVVGRGVDHLFFGKGSQVEVSSDEIGFKGSWYTATIIGIDHNTPRPPSSPTSSGKKKRKLEPKRYLVQYATLLEDEGEGEDDRKMPKKPLREYVDGALMRPLPPPTESQHAYELNDVVDASHRDGWWTGVVFGVLDDDGSRFRVFFENPPEEFEFARSELRVHHDWVDNKWVRAEKKAHGLLEDCTPKKAAVSTEGLESQSIEGSGTENPQRRHGKSSVKSMKNKKKHVNDQPSHNVKEIIESKNGVSSKGRKRGRPKKLMTENLIGLVNGEEKNGAEITSNEMVVTENPIGLVNGEEKNGAESTSNEVVVKENAIGLVNGEEKNGAESTSYEMVKGSASNDGEQSTLAGISIQEIPILNHGYPPQLPLRQYNIMDNVLDFRLAKIDNQISETIAGKSGRKPRSCTSKRRNQRSRTNKKSPTQDSQGPEKPSEQFEDRPQLMWYDSNTQEACMEKASDESKDRPQLMWREGMNSPFSVHDSRTSFDLNVVQSADASDGQDESAMPSPAIATCHNNVSEKDKKLPFEKRSPVWATLERMEIFQKMPQNPHFSPLVKSKEDSREGLAIGQMVIFSSVVEKTSKLQFSDPRSIIDSSLETLSDLETHGFDVHPIRRRLKELLSKKENQGHLLEESKEIGTKIAEQCVEKVKIGEEICEINKKMEELQEKLALATAMEKMTDYEIDTLKLKMDVIDLDIQNAQRDFERLAAAPW